MIIKKRTVFIVAVLRLENIFQRRQSTEMKQWEKGRTKVKRGKRMKTTREKKRKEFGPKVSTTSN